MKKILQTLTIAVTLGLTGCNDSYLERLPTTEVTEATAFTSFTTCSNYLTNLYQMFSGGYTSFQGPAMVSGALGTSTRDIYSGILTNYGSGVGNIPNSYEMPRNSLDLSVAKRLGKWTLKFAVRDLLAEPCLFKQMEDVVQNGKSRTIEETTRRYRPGRNFNITIGYNL